MKAGILFFGRKRPGFDPVWGGEIERGVREQAAAGELEMLVHDSHVVDEASLAAAVDALRAADVDVPVVVQPTMSDGRLAARLGQLWDGPLVLWATPERPNAEKVTACSLVGTHVFAANLRQLGRPFELVYGMPGEVDTDEALLDAVLVAHAFRRLRTAKLGLIGYHAPGFIDMHADPFDLSAQFGAQMWHTGLHELLDRMKAVPEEEVKEDVEQVLGMGLPMNAVGKDDLAVNSRFYLAVKALAEEERLDGLALREWPELPNLAGHWVYLAIARLLDDGFPVSCEGDVDGALTSLLGCAFDLGPGYLSDWLAHDEETITLWHGGCAPFYMCESASIGRHFNSNTPCVVDARLTPEQPLTLCRIWRCDGIYHLVAEEGVTLEPERPLAGTTGVVEMLECDPREWFHHLCMAGMPHHVVAFPGHCASLWRRFAQMAGVRMAD